jgi:hypothetical protein
MTEFKAGDKVRVEFEGVIEKPSFSYGRSMYGVPRSLHAVEGSCDGFGFHQVRDSHGSGHVIWDSYEGAHQALKLADPENWPPKTGDLWKTEDGTHYFARHHAVLAGEVVLISEHGDIIYGGLDALKAKRPSLAQRKTAA